MILILDIYWNVMNEIFILRMTFDKVIFMCSLSEVYQKIKNRFFLMSSLGSIARSSYEILYGGWILIL